MNIDLLTFLTSQRMISIATVDENTNPWVCNVYYSINPNGEIFFVSSPNTNHSKHIAKHPQVAFTVSWYDRNDMGNRKAVQGKGVCTQVTDLIDVGKLLLNHYKYFPDWKEFVNIESIRDKIIESRPYVIKPSYMKFFNDELYGEEGVKEFEL